MPSIVLSDNGVSSGSAGLKTTAASDGALALQTTTAGGTATTAVTLDTSQNVLVGMASYGVTNAGVSLSPTASSSFYVAGGTAVTIGRGTSDGTAVQFNRSGTNVGTIAVATTGLTMTGTNGITFTGTQTASADANTLDDYEEGTFTPTINLLGTLTYAAQSGRYVKIGKWVTVLVNVAVSSTNTTQDSTAVLISGLPFSVSNTDTAAPSCMLTERVKGTNNATAPNIFIAQPDTNSTNVRVYANNYNGTFSQQSYFDSLTRNGYTGNTAYFYFSAIYITTS